MLCVCMPCGVSSICMLCVVLYALCFVCVYMPGMVSLYVCMPCAVFVCPLMSLYSCICDCIHCREWREEERCWNTSTIQELPKSKP